MTYVNTKSFVRGGTKGGVFWFDCGVSSAQQAICTVPFKWDRNLQLIVLKCGDDRLQESRKDKFYESKIFTINEHPTIWFNLSCPRLNPCLIDSQWSTFLHVPLLPSCIVHELPSASKQKKNINMFTPKELWNVFTFGRPSWLYLFVNSWFGVRAKLQDGHVR